MQEWIVSPEHANKKLITFLSEHLQKQYSARAIKKSIESNHCQVNGRVERFASYVLVKGDRVQLNLEPSPSKSTSGLGYEPSRVLYEDEALVVYNKPPQVNCDDHGILSILKKKYPTLRLIHRLDQDTTGILLCAKNQLVFDKMVAAFKRFEVHKTYLAIVDGVVHQKSGSIDNYLGKKHVYVGQTIWGAVSKENGLHARTDWILGKQGKNAALLYCIPKTGRTHQIRVHLAGMGHPILGDFQYAKKYYCNFHPPRYLLHAYKVQFIHPLTGLAMHLQAPIPDDFSHAFHVLFGSDITSQLDL